MGKKVIVVESPSKAKTISSFLGDEFKVLATKGHIRDLPERRFGIKIEKGSFTPQYVVSSTRRQIVNQLKQEVKGADQIFIATDEDREGEAIGYHLGILLGRDPTTLPRIVFHEITPRAIREALKTPRTIDLNRVNAQQARRLLDRIVGYKLSPLLNKKLQRGLSAGRVQSATLKLIVDREREILQFKPKIYYSIEGFFKGVEGKLVEFQGKKVEQFTLVEEKEAKEWAKLLSIDQYRVEKVEKRLKRITPPPPFMTSTLQQVASSELKFSPKKTMEIAQKLYEGVDTPIGKVGLITYMRTDSLHIAPEAQQEAKRVISERFGPEFVELRQFKTKNRSAQEAHEAIRPTHLDLTPEELEGYLSSDELKLYRLIYTRFLASQMKPATYQIKLVSLGGKNGKFKLSGRKLVEKGFYQLTGLPSEEKKLPSFQLGEELTPEKVKYTKHSTNPPERYTEASLIKKMEELGIGRPSTYAPTMTLLKRRNYIQLEKRRIKPTETAFKVIQLLEKHFPEIVDSHFTAEMEEMLDQIATGSKEWQEVLREFYYPFEEQIKRGEMEIPSQKVEKPTGERCPKCGGELVIRKNRYGQEFIGCKNFPKCRYTRPLKPLTLETVEGVQCPECGGQIVVRYSKKGKFYGCANYPKCRFATSLKPAPVPCPKCGYLMGLKELKKGRFYQCLKCKHRIEVPETTFQPEKV